MAARRIGLLLLLSSLAAVAQLPTPNTTLTGKFYNAGAPFNGTISLSLPSPTTVLTGTCGGPLYLLPVTQQVVTVSNGILQGSPKVWGADCMQPGQVAGNPLTGIPYNVLVRDTNGNTLVVDQWLIYGASFDVGTAQSVLYTPNTAFVGQPAGAVNTIQIAGAGGAFAGATNFTISGNTLFTGGGAINAGPISSSGSVTLTANGAGFAGPHSAVGNYEVLSDDAYQPNGGWIFGVPTGSTAGWRFFTGAGPPALPANPVTGSEIARLDPSGNLTVKGSMNNNGVWAGSHNITVSALSTAYNLGVGAAVGFLWLRDYNAGGVAFFFLDPNHSPAQLIGTSYLGNVTAGSQVTYNGGTGDWQLTITAGSVPRTIQVSCHC